MVTPVCCMQDSSQGDMQGQVAGSGMDLSDLARAPTHAQPVPRVDSQGKILSADALKMRGMHAAQYHKTSIDTMLHSRHAGATPYRTVLGNVRPPPLPPPALSPPLNPSLPAHVPLPPSPPLNPSLPGHVHPPPPGPTCHLPPAALLCTCAADSSRRWRFQHSAPVIQTRRHWFHISPFPPSPVPHTNPVGQILEGCIC